MKSSKSRAEWRNILVNLEPVGGFSANWSMHVFVRRSES